MPDKITEQVRKKEPFLNALEEMDRTGKLKKATSKEIVSFTIDSDLMIDFRNYCRKNSISMSGKIESWIRGFLENLEIIK